jgi:hypothetical protein
MVASDRNPAWSGEPVERRPSSFRRGRRAVGSCLLILVVMSVLVAASSPARASAPEVVLDGPRVGEYQPIRGAGWIAWQQNTRKRPTHYDLYVRPVAGGPKSRVNAKGLNGANGDIEGNLLVYQQFRRKGSGLRFFDLTTRDRSKPPAEVNTEHWEYWPSMSGQWLLFGRLMHNGSRRLILFDLSTGRSRVLARTRGERSFLAPGQVSGDWAVWSRCASASPCNVVRYRISTDESDIIDNPNHREQHSPSVNANGTVYFASGDGDCGSRVRLIRERLDDEELWRLPNGDDIGRTHLQMRPRGNTVLYDEFSCGRHVESDAWQIVG